MKRVQMTRNHAVKSSLLYFSFFFSDNEDKNLKHLSAAEGMKYMNIGNAITEIRKTQGLTQEEFGALFHVTRQTVSNWENEKNYPDLQILVNISDQFNVSLDQLLKSDQQMILQIDKERSLGKLRRKKKIIDFLNGAGTGLILCCLYSPDTWRKALTITIAVIMIITGYCLKTKYDEKMEKYLQ